MQQMSRIEIVRELAKVAELIQAGAVTGVFLIATNANGSSTELIVPPLDARHIEKMMFALDRVHFRARVAMYLTPANIPGTHLAPERKQ